MMFKMLQCMEVEFWHHLDKENIKDSAISGICKNEDVLFYWELLSGMCETEERDYLLKLIAELWIVIRGFAYASGWMEEHKQVNKKLCKNAGRKLIIIVLGCALHYYNFPACITCAINSKYYISYYIYK